MAKWAKRILIVTAFCYTLICLGMWAFQARILYHPDFNPEKPEYYGLKGFEEIRFKTSDGVTITGWYSKAEEGKPTLLHFHGNGGNIANRPVFFKALADDGLGVLAIDYRGYGASSGEPSEAGFYEDGRSSVKFLTDQKHVPLNTIVLYGESIGTGVAVQLATEFQAAALILQSPYASVAALGKQRYPWLPIDLLLRDRFDSIEKIENVKVPLLLMHGDIDRVIPIEEAQKLFAKANEPKSAAYFEGKGHNDLGVEPRKDATLNFLKNYHFGNH